MKKEENAVTTLFAVRHGETEWNKEGRQQGHLNSPLTSNGIEQAKLLAKGLRRRGIERIICSDLGRAVQTCEIIASELDLGFELDAGLRERNLGIMEGLTKGDFAEQFPHDSAMLKSGCADYVIPNGESRLQRYERCVNAANRHIQEYKGNRLLIVGHGGVLNSFFYHTFSIDLSSPRNFSLMNAAISSFEIVEGRWKLITWGDVSHLKGLETLDDN